MYESILSEPEVDQLALLEALLTDWGCHARPNQLRPPTAVDWWNVQAGRGFGKTRSGSAHTLDMMEAWGETFLGGACSYTAHEVRETMLEGPAGLLASARGRGYGLEYNPSLKQVRHPSGAKLMLFSGEKGEVRGPNTNYFWCDELPYWKVPLVSFENIMATLRLVAPWPGPHGIITSTPKRRSAISKRLLKMTDLVTTTRGTSAENSANQTVKFKKNMQLIHGVAGGGLTSMGQQELLGVLLDDNAGGWTEDNIAETALPVMPVAVPDRIVISHDPATTSGGNSDDHGISVCAEAFRSDGMSHIYVIADATQTDATPPQAIAHVLLLRRQLMDRYGGTVDVVVEDNQGGEMWDHMYEKVGESMNVPTDIKRVHATRSKTERAEAAALVWEQKRGHICGDMPELVAQMTEWAPGMDSPDRMDAMVHAVLELEGSKVGSLFSRY